MLWPYSNVSCSWFIYLILFLNLSLLILFRNFFVLFCLEQGYYAISRASYRHYECQLYIPSQCMQDTLSYSQTWCKVGIVLCPKMLCIVNNWDVGVYQILLVLLVFLLQGRYQVKVNNPNVNLQAQLLNHSNADCFKFPWKWITVYKVFYWIISLLHYIVEQTRRKRCGMAAVAAPKICRERERKEEKGRKKEKKGRGEQERKMY